MDLKGTIQSGHIISLDASKLTGKINLSDVTVVIDSDNIAAGAIDNVHLSTGII